MHLAVRALRCSWLFLAAKDLLGTVVRAAVGAVLASCAVWMAKELDYWVRPDSQQCPLSALEEAEAGGSGSKSGRDGAGHASTRS
ncbi:hypothetical protein Aduo_006114 [Ancylostoma duodenale]